MSLPPVGGPKPTEPPQGPDTTRLQELAATLKTDLNTLIQELRALLHNSHLPDDKTYLIKLAETLKKLNGPSAKAKALPEK